jgi:uncharacterized lipoprotein YddW (UPF0748 family)
MIDIRNTPFLSSALLALAACQGRGALDVVPLPLAARDERAMWVTRFDYKSEADIAEIVRRCDNLGIDTILFQVRGNATAFYPSSIEPWAAELGGKDPGFDPLAVALREAHAREIELVAWVNVMTAWWGTTPPADPRQLYNARPEWMWYDQHGERQALSDKFYVGLNPCLPEVRHYLVGVLRELVERYRLDGLHLDYLRFPNEPPGTPAGSGRDYPRDARTLELFLGARGTTPDKDPIAWSSWRAEQVTALLRDIRYMIDRTRPGLELSAAVGPEPARALSEHFQDTKTWIAERLLDRYYPMNYAADPTVFQRRVDQWRELAPRDKVVMGIKLDAGPPELVRQEIETACKHFAGFALFAYQALYDSANDRLVAQDPATSKERGERRRGLVPYLESLR